MVTASISTNKQNIERQVHSILEKFPQAIITNFTGPEEQGRKQLEGFLDPC